VRQDYRTNSGEEKRLARKRYVERQFDKWIKWSFSMNGKIRYKDILEMQEKLNIINKQDEGTKRTRVGNITWIIPGDSIWL
jgi:hypothetical protein